MLHISPEIIVNLKNICGESYVYEDQDTLIKYSRDETENLSFHPDIVVNPSDSGQISKILSLANHHRIPVYTRGGGTGLSAGSLPVFGGIVLLTERMNRILEIDEENFQATVEPGVITEVFQNELEERGLCYPVDPASRGSCFLGGNIAECSGGPRAAKYGVSRNYVLALDFVIPSGEIISTGSKTIKNVTGYSLTQLIIGSEGTLGVVTKIVFRIISRPRFKKLLLIAFRDIQNCISSVAEYYKKGVNPAALEFLEKSAIKAAEKQLNMLFPNGDAEAHLIIELDGNNLSHIDEEIQLIAEVSYSYDAYDVILAEDRQKMDDIWKLRRSVGEAVKSISVYKEEDTVVPRGKMPELLEYVKKISLKYNIATICYGHAGDGNLHINILKENLSDDYWNNNVNKAIKEIFEYTVMLGGTISGEHGIGFTQKDFLPIALAESEIKLMREIKRVFDPNNILNPGKIFPDKYL